MYLAKEARSRSICLTSKPDQRLPLGIFSPHRNANRVLILQRYLPYNELTEVADACLATLNGPDFSLLGGVAMNRFRLWLSAVVVTAAVVGCSRNSSDANTEQTYLTIKGSDTMVHLVSAWAEDYMATHPRIEISVTGGGSGTGIAALINGTTDIAAASRDMKESEVENARTRGVEPVEIAVARDGIAIIVHSENPIDALTVEQLEKIYTGQTTNWRDVGGEDRDILVLSRESNSGTYVFFQEHVLNKKDYSPRARLMPATSGILQSVGDDRGAIGYVGLGYVEGGDVDRVKVIGVKERSDADAIRPSSETVQSGEYSVARPLFLYTNGQPRGLVAEFVAFALSPEGQDVVRETGYVVVR